MQSFASRFHAGHFDRAIFGIVSIVDQNVPLGNNLFVTSIDRGLSSFGGKVVHVVGPTGCTVEHMILGDKILSESLSR